jgi:hypothetical protein
MSQGDTSKGAAVSIVLAGSLDLARRLDRIRDQLPEQSEVNISLTPLSPRDVESYVLNRLHMAGFGGNQVFLSEAIARVARYSHGNPQAINRICRAAMVIAAGQSRETVSAQVVDQVATNGDGGRPQETMRPETIKIEHERRPPQVNAELDRVRETVASANSRRHGVLSRLQTAGPAFTPTTSDEALTRERADQVFAGAPSGINHTDGSAMPSGRDLTSQVLVDARDLRRAPARGNGRKRWAALGVLSMVGAVVIYLFADGETNDKTSIRSDIPASSGEDTSPTNSVAASAPSRAVSSPSEDERSPAPERIETTPHETTGSPLENAVLLGDVKAVAALLDAGADINAPVADGGTLLTVAAGQGDETLVREHNARGADPARGIKDLTTAETMPQTRKPGKTS